ncbi:hypothetical protein ABT299_20190 [Spirillospora sp. NPDC000708]
MPALLDREKGSKEVDTRTRLLTMGLILALAVIAGIVAALLKQASGSPLSDTVLYGFAAFGGTVGLILLVVEGFKRL